MNRWFGKVAVVTGASAGIGAAITIDLVKAGVIVVGLARRENLVEELKTKIPINCSGKLYAKKCDITNETEVKNIFLWIEKNLGGIDILINNAGIIKHSMNLVDKDNTDAVRQILDTNVLAVVFCTREAFHSMKNRNVDGHIIIISSLSGHRVPYVVGRTKSYNIYPSSKYAITAMIEVLRQEFQAFNTKIKISAISPGLVKTEAAIPQNQSSIGALPVGLDPEDVSQSVLYVLGTPPRVQIHDLLIRPLGVGF